MRPPSAAGTAGLRPAMCGSAAATALRLPSTFSLYTSRKSLEGASSKRRGCEMPAELTTTSRRPPCATAAASTAARQAASSVTSAAWTVTRWPA